MSAVYALYPSPEAAQRAVDGLRAAGIPEGRITILSAEPFEEHEFAHRDKATWMGWIALAGGITGLAFSTWLARMTELAWPLRTGNMPIVAWWPNLIIMFETTMLFAILATVLTLLYTLFSKFVPIISIWELKVGEHPTHVTAGEIAEEVLGEGRP